MWSQDNPQPPTPQPESEAPPAVFASHEPSWWEQPWVIDLAIEVGCVVGIIVAAFLANFLARRVIVPLIQKAVSRTKNEWDDVLFDEKVVAKVSWLAGAAVCYYAPLFFHARVEPVVLLVFQTVANAVMILSVVMALGAMTNAVDVLYQRRDRSNKRPIKGYLQLVRLIIYLIGVVLILAELLDKDPVVFVTGLGAFAAVLMLVFKDTILSLVASVQIASNDMVRVDDWVEIPSLGIDGDVMDIALHTVKIRNFDKTISTVPTSALVGNAMKNWRGMTESGGRRIKRSLTIDLSTIRFLGEDEVVRFSKFEVLKDYFDSKLPELDEHNSKHSDPELIANARRLTNVGTLRAYIIGYLRSKNEIHQQGMTFLIRQLQPNETGLPIELYIFTKTTNWVEYEGVQADIFDHLLAMVPEFGLRVYQRPSGADMANALAGMSEG